MSGWGRGLAPGVAYGKSRVSEGGVASRRGRGLPGRGSRLPVPWSRGGRWRQRGPHVADVGGRVRLLPGAVRVLRAGAALGRAGMERQGPRPAQRKVRARGAAGSGGPQGRALTRFLSAAYRLVSTVQATMATVSGLTVVLSCEDVVHDR